MLLNDPISDLLIEYKSDTPYHIIVLANLYSTTSRVKLISGVPHLTTQK